MSVMRAICAISECQLLFGADDGWESVMLFSARTHVFGR